MEIFERFFFGTYRYLLCLNSRFLRLKILSWPIVISYSLNFVPSFGDCDTIVKGYAGTWRLFSTEIWTNTLPWIFLMILVLRDLTIVSVPLL